MQSPAMATSSSVCSSPRSQRSSYCYSSATVSGPPSPQTAATTPRSCYGDSSPKPARQLRAPAAGLPPSLASIAAHPLTPPPETDDDADDHDGTDAAMPMPMPIAIEDLIKTEDQRQEQQQHLSSFYPIEMDDDAQYYSNSDYNDYSYSYSYNCSYDGAAPDPFCYYQPHDGKDDGCYFSPTSPSTTAAATATESAEPTGPTGPAEATGSTEPTATSPSPPAGLAGLGLAAVAAAGWAEYSQWTGYTGYPPAEAFYGPLPLPGPEPLPGAWACPAPLPVDPTAEWFTAEGKRVEYSAMSLHCATM